MIFRARFFSQFNDLLHEVPLLGLSIDLATAKSFPVQQPCEECRTPALLPVHAGADFKRLL